MKHIIDTSKPPFIYNGWTVVEHQKSGKIEWNPAEVSLYADEEYRTQWVEGNVLRERLKGKSPLNANVLDYLYEHQELIPEEWKREWGVFFWGTIYHGRANRLYVRNLRWLGTVWQRIYYWLGNDFSARHSAAVPASVLTVDFKIKP